MDKILIELTDQKWAGPEFEEPHLIKVMKEDITNTKPKLSDKYKGILTKEQGEDLNKHVQQMRSTWDNI